jgi:hypothetical protein
MSIEICQYWEAKSVVLEASHRIYNAVGVGPGPGFAVVTDASTRITIVEAEGFNVSAGTLYWQLFDGIAAPGAGATAIHSIQVPAGQSFYWKPLGGFTTTAAGIWCSSAAAATYVAGTPSFWALVKFVPLLDPSSDTSD